MKWISSKPGYILWLLVVTLTLLSLIFSIVYLKTNSQLDAWRRYTDLEVKKAVTLEKIISNIGYGGFIHNFKNAVLRSDEKLLDLSLKQLTAADQAINEYRAFDQLNTERLNSLATTLNEYRAKIPVARRMIKQAFPVTEIDRAVKVEDSNAERALSSLLIDIRDTSPRVINESIEYQMQFRQTQRFVFVLLSLLISVCFFFIWRASRRLNEQYTQFKLVFDLTPNAMLTANEKGVITGLNNEATKLFGIHKADIDNLCVDDLVPERLKNQHKRHREAFQNSSRTLPMSERGRVFFGRKVNGGEFPAAISIATYSKNNNKNSIIVVKDLTEENELRSEARTDSLTKAYNRRAFDEALQDEINRFNRSGAAFSIALIDIDDFKKINDTFGHDYGDSVLVKLSQTIINLVRSTDLFARWGGEEFALIMDATHEDGAVKICEKVRIAVEQAFLKDPVNVTVSIGVAECQPGQCSDELIELADRALYRSKGSGKNKTSVI